MINFCYMSEREPGSRLEHMEPEPIQTSGKKKPFNVSGFPAEQSSGPNEAPPVIPNARKERVDATNFIQFELMDSLVGREVKIRDPVAQVEGPTDDPLFKIGVIERNRKGNFNVVILRGRYYPYYTGDRQATFLISSQRDIDRMKITL